VRAHGGCVDVADAAPGYRASPEDLDATRQRMHDRRVARLLVTTPDGTLIGVVDAAES
jgi:hypothetical protein